MGKPSEYQMLKLRLAKCMIIAGVNTMSVKTLTAILHKEGQLFVAECPEVGTVSQGYSLEEAVANLREATELYLEEFPVTSPARSFLTTFEVTYG
jgi:predicted RNase H-like HicB family nuclease